MKINGLQAEIENEGEFVILKLKMHPQDFVKFVTDCNKIKKQKVKQEPVSLSERKGKFLADIAAYKTENEGKYPVKIYNDFYRYWTEANVRTNKMKFEEQKFFEVSKRLATFWGRISTEEKSRLWQLEKDKPKEKTLYDLNA